MSSPESIAIALGSNLGDRARNLRWAIDELRHVVSVVRLSSVYDTEPVGAPKGSPRFLNMVIAGHTRLTPESVIAALLEIERRLGRVRTGRNAPRTIDLDLILHSANVRRSRNLTVPHPRYLQRDFVTRPLHELGLQWRDPITGRKL